METEVSSEKKKKVIWLDDWEREISYFTLMTQERNFITQAFDSCAHQTQQFMHDKKQTE